MITFTVRFDTHTMPNRTYYTIENDKDDLFYEGDASTDTFAHDLAIAYIEGYVDSSILHYSYKVITPLGQVMVVSSIQV